MRYVLLLWLSFLSFICRAQVPSYVPTSGLVAWYPLDGNLNDVSGSGNNAVAYGSVVYGTNRYGLPLSSYKGNGLGEGDIPVNNFPTGNGARTISVFYKYKLPYAGGGKAFFGWGNNSFGGRFTLFAADDFVGVEYVNGYVRVASYTVDSCWHNLTATYPSTGGGSSAIKLYLDGTLVATSVYLPTSSFNTPSGPWHGLGGNIYYLPAYSDSWTGYLDDIGVWNRELTAAEVLLLWTGGGTSSGGSAPVISGTNSICQSSSATLTATPSGGAWSTSNAAVVSVSGGYITGVSAGTAVITYSIVSGCTTISDTQSITVTALPVASVTGTSNLCVGSSVTFVGSPGSGSWLSSNPLVASVNSATGVAGGVTTGSAIISYTVSNSCGTATDTQMVSVLALPYAGTVSGPSSLCVGSTGVFSSTASGGVWTSSIPSVASINSASGSSGGASAGSSVISYTVSNACGSTTDTQLVAVISVPLAGTVAGPSFLCPGSTGLFTSGVPGGVWSSSVPAVATVNSISGMAGGVVTGSSIISYTVSNACGSATDTQMVTVSTMPYAGTISGPSIVCAGALISLTGVVSGGAWSSSAVGVATVSAGFVGGVASGTTIISYTLTNSCGTATDTQMITVLPLPSVGNITGPLRVCIGAQITLTDSAPGGAWSSINSSVATVGAASGIVGGASAGVTLISYSISNSCGTTADTQSVMVLPLPDAGVVVSSVPVACLGGTISVSDAVPGGVWSSSSPSIATVDGGGVVSPLSAGTVIVTYTIIDDNGCTNYATTTLTISTISPLVITPEITSLKCSGDNNGAINITVSGGSGSYQYLWSEGSTSSSLSALSAGSYSVEVTDLNNGCKDTGTFVLSMPGTITPELTLEPDRCNAGRGSVSIINVSGGNPPMAYSWSSGSVGPSLSGLQSGNYVLTITDANLCVVHYDVVISEDSCDVVIVHNAITPNGDGYNDFWIIDNIENYPESDVKLFDKWGDEVFAAKGYKNNWGGGAVPDGTYYYLVKYDDRVLKGSLLIKR
jgi:gliding motility-associated-like protein